MALYVLLRKKKSITKYNCQLPLIIRCTLISGILKCANVCVRTNAACRVGLPLITAIWVCHHLPNQPLLRGDRAVPHLFLQGTLLQQEARCYSANAEPWVGQPAQASLLYMYKLWTPGHFSHSGLQFPTCRTESGRTLPMRSRSGLKQSVQYTLRTHSSCSKVLTITTVSIPAVPHITRDKSLEGELQQCNSH